MPILNVVSNKCELYDFISDTFSNFSTMTSSSYYVSFTSREYNNKIYCMYYNGSSPTDTTFAIIDKSTGETIKQQTLPAKALDYWNFKEYDNEILLNGKYISLGGILVDITSDTPIALPDNNHGIVPIKITPASVEYISWSNSERFVYLKFYYVTLYDNIDEGNFISIGTQIRKVVADLIKGRGTVLNDVVYYESSGTISSE